ncbi:MAG: cation:proton antiporter [Pseudomonadota bacterium]
MTETALLISGLGLLAYALFARRLASTVLTGPMMFLALGLALDAFQVVDIVEAERALHILAETTLVIVLFSDAAALDLDRLRRRFSWPERMLVLGLPLAMLLGTIVGVALLPGWPIWEVALLAAILAPTDAALGQAVVTDPRVPPRVREALAVESGVNDGMALPAVLMFACLAVGGVHDQQQSSWLVFALEQIGLGTLTGVAIGAAGAFALSTALERGLSGRAFEGVGTFALAGLCYLCASEIGGNGFIAAFTGGLVYGRIMAQRSHFVFEFMESEGQLLMLGTFLLIGASMAAEAIAAAETAWIVLILASLLVVRPVAIWLSLTGSDAPPPVRAFMGWFGPRGLATALFALIVLDEFEMLTHGHEILTIAVLAVLASTLLHGVTAAPGAGWIARRCEAEPPTEAVRAGETP